MTRVNLLLLAAVLTCALSTVTSTHRARLLFADMENEQARQKQIQVEWGQLQLEQSTWAKHALVEGVAERQLAMRAPDPRRLVFVTPGGGTPGMVTGSPAPTAAGAASSGAAAR
jgi:cell division protein FtsL